MHRGDESNSEKRMLSSRFCFNSCIFSGELSSHCSVLISNGALGDAHQRLLYIFKVAARGCVSLEAFQEPTLAPKGYLSLSLWCVGSCYASAGILSLKMWVQIQSLCLANGALTDCFFHGGFPVSSFFLD